MQSDYLADILKTLGWNDGFQIPVANEENKALEAEVARLTLARFKIKTDSENASQKCDALERHLKFVSQECEQVQKLITLHKKQLDTENHRLQITTAEKCRVTNDIRETTKRTKEVEHKNDEKKTEVKRNMEKIEKIKREVFWDEEALKAWDESLKKRDEDNDLLRKFSKEDERKFLELEAKRAGLQMEHLQREKTIAKMVNDLTNYESILDRTGKTIQSQIAERDALVTQWKEAVKILHQRDDTISELQDKLLDVAELLQNDDEIRKNEENLLNIEKSNNKELERESEDLNTQHSRYQKDLDRLVQCVLFLNSEINSIKRQVTKSANNLENERCRGKTLRKEIQNKRAEIDTIIKKVAKLKEKYESLKQANMNIADRCKQMEKLIDFETKQHNVYLSDSDRLSKSLFRIQSKLSEQIEITGNRELEIANLSSMVDGLQKTTRDAQSNVEKQKEAMYNMEFKIDQLEEKFSQLEKQKNLEEDEEIFNKIKELEKAYYDHTETKILLQEQISRIQDEMRRLTTSITNDEQKLKDLKNKLQNEKLDYEGGQKQMENAKCAAQEKQVEENILILKLKQFDQTMKKEQNEMYNLQKMKLNLERAMRERELNVNSKKELLYVQKRNLEDDRGRLRSDFKNRQIKADQLQGKYHMVTMSLGTDEEGQTLSVTHYKLKTAQDKYFLKQNGDILDSKIKTIENEIIAMENTLNVVNLTNAAFKKSLSQVEDSDKESQTMENLERRVVETTDQIRSLKKTLATDKQELKDLNRDVEDLKGQQNDLQQSLIKVEVEYKKLEKELADKQEKVNRTDKLLKKMEKKLNDETILRYEKDLAIQDLAEGNKSGLMKLSQTAENFREIKPALNNLAKDYDINLPEVKTFKKNLSDISLSSSCDILSTISSGSTTNKNNKIQKICSCSDSSSVSVASVVLSFNTGN